MNDTLTAVLVVIGGIVAIAAILTLPTYWLWNWLMPTVFELKELTIWQALGMNLLCGILFRSSSSLKK
jgi:hypothetical protein